MGILVGLLGQEQAHDCALVPAKTSDTKRADEVASKLPHRPNSLRRSPVDDRGWVGARARDTRTADEDVRDPRRPEH
jgi:hypothetical protein